MIRGLVFSFRIFDRRAIYCESSSFGGLLFGKGEHWCWDGSCCLPFYGMCATAPTPPSPLTQPALPKRFFLFSLNSFIQVLLQINLIFSFCIFSFLKV